MRANYHAKLQRSDFLVVNSTNCSYNLHFFGRLFVFVSGKMMSRLGFKSSVYHGDVFLGELDNVPVKGVNFQFPKNEIKIHHISPNSERCHPLAVLQTISAASIRCKLEPGANSSLSSNPDESPLINLHASMFYELKVSQFSPLSHFK